MIAQAFNGPIHRYTRSNIREYLSKMFYALLQQQHKLKCNSYRSTACLRRVPRVHDDLSTPTPEPKCIISYYLQHNYMRTYPYYTVYTYVICTTKKSEMKKELIFFSYNPIPEKNEKYIVNTTIPIPNI